MDCRQGRRRFRVSLVIIGVIAWSLSATAEPVAVRHREGFAHGFLVLRNLEGTLLADGDLIQTATGNRVTSRLVFHFTDKSLYDETTVFSQKDQFHLLTEHLVEQGPSFPHPVDLTIDGETGAIAMRYTDDEGRSKSKTKQMELPPDLANGLVETLLLNIDRERPPKSFDYVAATSDPRLVKLAVAVAGEDSFSVGGAVRKATHYVLKVDIGGVAGLLASLVGKQPADAHVWITTGDAPAFVKAEEAFYNGGPIWRIELVGPVWPHETTKR